MRNFYKIQHRQMPWVMDRWGRIQDQAWDQFHDFDFKGKGSQNCWYKKGEAEAILERYSDCLEEPAEWEVIELEPDEI